MRFCVVGIIAICVFFGSVAQGTVVHTDDATALASRWLADGDLWSADGVSASLVGIEEIRSDVGVCGYLCTVAPRGWMVIAALREMSPVVACSLDSVPPNDLKLGPIAVVGGYLAAFTKAYVDEFGSVAAVPLAKDQGRYHTAYARWDQISSGLVDKSKDVEVGPLLTSSWHQDEPYNAHVPWYEGQECPAGCVAIAVGQILHYFKQPLWGRGTHTNIDWEAGAAYHANFEEPIDWANITDRTWTISPQAERDAVAHLVYQIGVGVDMKWRPGGSGAYSTAVPDFLTEHMRFTSPVSYVPRELYSDAEWFGMVCAQVDAFRPMYYSMTINGTSGHVGHAVVCDGYRIDAAGQAIHLNYGWGSHVNTKFWLLSAISVEQSSEVMVCGLRPAGGFVEMLGNDVECAAWGDYNNDSDPDLFVADTSNPGGRLFKNRNGESFIEVALPAVGVQNQKSCAWADYNNDGWIDVVLGGDSVVLYRNNGNGTFSVVNNLFDLPPGQVYSIAWGDYNRDGFVDLMTSSSLASTRVFQNTGGGAYAFLDVTPAILLTFVTSCAIWTDINGDGFLDITTIGTGASSTRMLRGDQSGNYVDVTPASVAAARGASLSYGDIDNDGDLDLFTAGIGLGNHLLRNDGTFGFVDITPSAMVLQGVVTYTGSFADHDNDGLQDLYLTNASIWGSEYPNYLFRNGGGDGFSLDQRWGPAVQGYGKSNAAAWADFDLDGDVDLFADGATSSATGRIWRNNMADGGPAVSIALRGTVSNAAAIGARVTVAAGGSSLLRSVDGTSTGTCQNFQRLCVGVGSPGAVDGVSVLWPSGRNSSRPGCAGGCSYEIIEFAASPVSELTPAALVVTVSPNPFNPLTRLSITSPVAAPCEVSIYDIRGALTKRLYSGLVSEGVTVVEWDGTDATNGAVASGRYFGVVRVAAEERVVSLTVLR